MDTIQVHIDSRFPVFMQVDVDGFGKFFAAQASDDQVAIFAAMVEHMKPHPMQWDYIAIELEKPENASLRSQLREVLFPEVLE